MENNYLDMFLIYCLFLIVYGFKLRIWEQSVTTKYVIIYVFGVSIISYIFGVFEVFYYLMLIGIGLLMLFIRAVLIEKHVIYDGYCEESCQLAINEKLRQLHLEELALEDQLHNLEQKDYNV